MKKPCDPIMRAALRLAALEGLLPLATGAAAAALAAELDELRRQLAEMRAALEVD